MRDKVTMNDPMQGYRAGAWLAMMMLAILSFVGSLWWAMVAASGRYALFAVWWLLVMLVLASATTKKRR